tara:strand:- start:2156 stop:2605 length:450 start_codon:yes stop_codon:yes gene_type:complete
MKLKIYYAPYILKANQSAIDGAKDLSKAYVIIEEGRIKEYYGYLKYSTNDIPGILPKVQRNLPFKFIKESDYDKRKNGVTYNYYLQIENVSDLNFKLYLSINKWQWFVLKYQTKDLYFQRIKLLDKIILGTIGAIIGIVLTILIQKLLS